MRAFFSRDRWVKPSTRAFWKAARTREHGSFWEAVHGLFYLKWPEFYIGVGLGRNRLSRFISEPAWRIGKFFRLWSDDAGARFADTYHGKAMPLAEAVRFIRIERAVSVTVPEKVLPYALARDVILENKAALALLRCPCRATMKNPCTPLEVCIIVGKPIVDFVLEHHPDKARRIDADEAVAVVEASQRRGHVSHAFFKEAVLGRYYAVCNCCSCCCGAMQAHRSGTPMLASSGYTATVDAAACIGCGKCVRVCPFGAVALDGNDKKSARAVVDADSCLGCGVCTMQCPQDALALERNQEKPAPLLAADIEGVERRGCVEGAFRSS